MSDRRSSRLQSKTGRNKKLHVDKQTRLVLQKQRLASLEYDNFAVDDTPPVVGGDDEAYMDGEEEQIAVSSKKKKGNRKRKISIAFDRSKKCKTFDQVIHETVSWILL